MTFGIQLTIFLGIIALASLMITVVFGALKHYFHKPVLRYHIFFAFLTLVIALVHTVFVIIKYYF